MTRGQTARIGGDRKRPADPTSDAGRETEFPTTTAVGPVYFNKRTVAPEFVRARRNSRRTASRERECRGREPAVRRVRSVTMSRERTGGPERARAGRSDVDRVSFVSFDLDPYVRAVIETHVARPRGGTVGQQFRRV